MTYRERIADCNRIALQPSSTCRILGFSSRLLLPPRPDDYYTYARSPRSHTRSRALPRIVHSTCVISGGVGVVVETTRSVRVLGGRAYKSCPRSIADNYSETGDDWLLATGLDSAARYVGDSVESSTSSPTQLVATIPRRERRDSASPVDRHTIRPISS